MLHGTAKNKQTKAMGSTNVFWAGGWCDAWLMNGSTGNPKAVVML